MGVEDGLIKKAYEELRYDAERIFVTSVKTKIAQIAEKQRMIALAMSDIKKLQDSIKELKVEGFVQD